ncbi:PREDICTED: uncharacterized protein LOC109174470 [Ipomoea nil]|uniref:uncharacterized protein LOC109174470 n=1 Tax=Ipomoea nil TaxID=35883 RepID=UPI0009019585|nr:PREDICTED: uncharacterized protein LOC109174470 [Ipomoea nil]
MGDFHGLRVARGAPALSHLFFADDSLLFFKANVQEAGVIRRCLTLYEELSGQTINYHKSNICFSRNTQLADRNVVTAVFGVQQAANFGKYLGFPTFVGRNKRAVFAYIGDKVRQRIGSWNKKLLSQAGKEILLKSMTQAMPTFTMSVFLLPDTLCKDLERVMNRFWWRNGRDGRGIHWMAWDKLSKPKKFGGLGFKDLRAFNLAMLGKQGWRFLTNRPSLVARVYKARRRIGNGDATLVWGDPWLMGESTPKILSDKPEHLGEVKVSGLIDPAASTWDMPLLNELFLPDDIARICMAGDGFGVWLEALFQKVDDNHFSSMMAIIYQLWRQRNTAVWEYKLGIPRRVYAIATATIDAWRATCVLPARQHGAEAAAGHARQAAAATAAWTNEDCLQCSFDAGYVAPHLGWVFLASFCNGRTVVSLQPRTVHYQPARVLSWRKHSRARRPSPGS